MSRTTRILGVVAGAAAVVGTTLAPAVAAPAAPTGQRSTTEHCVVADDGGLSCAATLPQQRSGVVFTLAVTVYDLPGYRGASRSIYLRGNGCTGEFGGAPDAVVDLGPLAGIGSSVRKNPGGHCNWQLVGGAGNRSTWVEGSRDDLSELGGGWSNRAVRVRLD